MQQTVAFFSKLGIYTRNRDGYLYPASLQASSVLEVLEAEARYLKVKIKCREQVTDICACPDREQGRWLVKTASWQYPADSVIIACGSPASEIAGSCTSGYELAKKLGHTLIKPLPALVPLVCKASLKSGQASAQRDASPLPLTAGFSGRREASCSSQNTASPESRSSS